MGWFNKAKDPMAARQAELDREIQAIQRRISNLAARPAPALRPSAPRGQDSQPVPPPRPEPVPAPVPGSFHGSRPVGPMAGAPTDRFNLVEAWQRVVQRLGFQPRRPTGLVHLMAAGSVHGLRPLRYERKIARRRFLLSLGLLLLLLYGIAREVF
ncbi:MAG: hypothetical protein FJ396_10675 [Verrucomicrobia bacterium]|nr:hypothetical protein [Verrucomicrobiota bacterium]